MFAPECTISGYQSWEASILFHWNQNHVWEWFRTFRYALARKKMHNLCSCLNALFRGTKVMKHPFYSIGTKMMFGCISEHFTNLRHVKICKTCVSDPNALFRGTKVVKNPFYSTRTKMMFGSVSEHSANLRHVKDAKLMFAPECTISGYKSSKRPFYSIGTKMMFGSVSEYSANLRHVKRCKTCVRTRMHYFGVPKLQSIHSTPLEPNLCLGVF
jgi:hypothetical protein